MKLVDAVKPFKVINISKSGRVVKGSFSLGIGESTIINPLRETSEILEAIELFCLLEHLKVDTDVKARVQDEIKNTVTVNSLKNEHGDKHEHIVFNPDEASKGRLFNVEEIDSSKSVEVKSVTSSYESTEDAELFLEKHWKTIEKELSVVDSIKKLEFLLSVAKDIGMEGNKKYELIEERFIEVKARNGIK